MAVKQYATFEFRNLLPGSGSQGSSRVNNGTFDLVLPFPQNVLITSIFTACFIIDNTSSVVNNSNGGAGRPYFSIRFAMLNSGDLLLQQKGAVKNDFDTNLDFKGGLDEVYFQTSNDEPNIKCGVISNGIRIIQAGYVFPASPGNIDIFYNVTFEYEFIKDC